MEGVSEADLKKHPVTVEVQDEATGQMMEQVVGYRLDTELSIYEQEKPIRCVVEWDGKAGSKKRARLEELYQIKLANLERETILRRLLNLQGEFVRHKTKRIILVVADRFEDRRMQAAYERYCVILN